MSYLPRDILHIICAQLCDRRDLNTLFNCACSGEPLARIAVMFLYRMPEVARDTISSCIDENTDGDHTEEFFIVDGIPIQAGSLKGGGALRILRKRAGLWRTIILSSLGKTLYPYSQYIRTLNLLDLEWMLGEDTFKARISNDFFQGELARFKSKADFHSYARESANMIGEAISKQTPRLEELTGQVFGGIFSQWIPQSPRLTHLRLGRDAVMKDNGTLIRLHCPLFKRMHLPLWYSNARDYDPTDPHLADFLNELRPQSLESFKADFDVLETKTFQALRCQGESLTELKFDSSRGCTANILNISLLECCTNLVSLSLEGTNRVCGDTDLTRSHYDTFCETVNWLKKCKKLQILACKNVFSAPWMSQLLLGISCQLTSLEFEGFQMLDAKFLQQALENQTRLQSLHLANVYKGECDVRDVDCLVEGLCNLYNLTDLNLGMINIFTDRHIAKLARSLPKLEVWSIAGYELTDSIWGEFASLRSLRELKIVCTGVTSFTVDGILDFIKQLGPGNEGLGLSVRGGHLNSNLSRVERKMINKKFA